MATGTEEGEGLGTTAQSPPRTQMAGNRTEAQRVVLKMFYFSELYATLRTQYDSKIVNVSYTNVNFGPLTFFPKTQNKKAS